MNLLHLFTHSIIFILLFQDSQYFIGTLGQAIRHAGHFSHLYTKAMTAAARRQLAQEDNLIARFFMGDVVVLYALQLMLQFVQLMIVGCEDRLCFVRMLLYKFYNRPGNGNTIVGAGTPANLV
ncbi:hypothetical protein D3C80_1662690 [compost metagenome]